MHEVEYDASRNERLLHERGLSRRDLVKLGASLPVALGIAGYASPSPVARAATTENGSPIAKRLPPEWLVNFGSNAEMRWDAVAALGFITPNERFFVRDHTGTLLGDNRELSRIRACMWRTLAHPSVHVALPSAWRHGPRAYCY